jgi:hypothetical protein
MTEEQEAAIRAAASAYADARSALRSFMAMNTPTDEEGQRRLQAEYALAEVRAHEAGYALRKAQGFAP